MAAPWDPSAQTLQWGPQASLQPPPLHTWIPPKPSYEQAVRRQAAEISLWTVVAAMQAVERKVDLQAGRLCGLERRAGLAEKKVSGVERAVAEFSPHLDVLGTLIQEYGQLRKRLEDVESLLKSRSFWIVGLPPGSGGEISQARIPVNMNEVSIYLSEQEWENLGQMEEGLPKNDRVSLSGGDASSKPGFPSRTEAGEELSGEGREEHPGEVEDSPRGPAVDADNMAFSRQLEVAPAVMDKWDLEETAALMGKSPGARLPSSECARAESGPGNLAVFPSLPTPLDQGPVPLLEEGVGYVEGQRPALRGSLEEPAEPRSFTTIVVQDGTLPGEAPYVCPECEKSFLYEEQYLLHQQAHSQGLGGSGAQQPGVGGDTCLECGHWFPHQASLREHRLWHSRERPHTCPECQKSFQLKIHLHLHERTHSANRKAGSYICGECGRSFSHHSNFLRHQMIHTGERPYACGECGKTFIRKEHLATHGRLHTGERPFRCPLCHKSFTRKQHLVGHQRMHEGQGAWPEDGPPQRPLDSRPSGTGSPAGAVGGLGLQDETFPP